MKGKLIATIAGTMLAVTFFTKPDAAIAGGVSRTCFGFKLEAQGDRIFLLANCRRRNNTISTAGMPISDYVTNKNGNLKWAPLGKFHESCEAIDVFYENQQPALLLRGLCKTRNGTLKRTVINLDEKISNQNGVMAADF